MPHIQVLDQITIDKIAAGEVIERPASIVKELVENAIDAKATSVTVEIKDGGISFIRVTDNGCGIEADEVRCAFLRHSTSKIRTAEDLSHIGSLGFRGEALSSIAAVSQVELITKTEEASELFDKEQVNVHNTLQEVINDLHSPIVAHGINVKNEINPQTVIEGNKTLVYAIFRNLIENSINYAGDHISIGVNNYMEDKEFYYFSYYDTGQGIEENHLNRIFERFYRVCEGRSRQNGGSGLGLSIVKNAVLFHKGDISAKNRKDGGLEFLFSLKKTLF